MINDIDFFKANEKYYNGFLRSSSNVFGNCSFYHSEFNVYVLNFCSIGTGEVFLKTLFLWGHRQDGEVNMKVLR